MTMEITKTIKQTRQSITNARANGKRIGLVPTMGALHDGHISLIEAAAQNCDYVVVTIFVNPTQFGPTEDLDQYPRDLAGDLEKCKNAHADLVFAPSVEEMYPAKNSTWVDVDQLTNNLCGANRPGHFRGVTTVCTKLFNIVCPDIAFFGQKDAQQVAVIKQMVKDLNMPLEIQPCPIIREPDGLAMSSRNQYLSDQHRKEALLLSKSLNKCLDFIKSGERNCDILANTIKSVLSRSESVEIEYISLVDMDSLQDIAQITDSCLIAIAARLGNTRLIDNMIVDLNKL